MHVPYRHMYRIDTHTHTYRHIDRTRATFLAPTLLQAKAVCVVHRVGQHPLKLPTRTMVAVLWQQEQVETCVGSGQALRGLTTIALDNQLKFLQAADGCQIA